MFDEQSSLQFCHRLPKFLRVHHDRAEPSHGLLDGSCLTRAEADAFVACFYNDFSSMVEGFEVSLNLPDPANT